MPAEPGPSGAPQAPPTPSTRPGTREASGTLRYFDAPPTPATLTVREYSASDRWRRAALAWAGCWGAAVAAVFLPVLHFILVPALLVAGPVLARRRLSERRTIVTMAGRCPACSTALSEPLRSAPRLSHRLRCDGCGRAIEIVPETSLLVD